MSTNYYAFGPFPGGDPSGEGLHIGQAAAGWRFLFRAQPGLGLTTFSDWENFLQQPGVTIENEYGREVPVTEMIQTVTETTDGNGNPLRARFKRPTNEHYLTSGGHAFSRREFF